MNIATIVEFIESMIKSSTVSNVDGAYGSGMAGAGFDPLGFIKKPQVILRVVSVVFATIVFTCIATEENYKQGKCPLNDDPHACGFGITIAVIAFILCIVFLIIDARFDSFSNVKTRKRAVIVDMVISGVWAFMWFVCFCYLTDAWRKTDEELSNKAGVHRIQTAIAFSFFSIITWAMICLLNFLRYRQGVSTIFSSGYEDPSQNIGPSEFDTNINDSDYRQAPFNNNGGYQQPTY